MTGKEKTSGTTSTTDADTTAHQLSRKAGQQHLETNFAQQAPQLLWWTHLGRDYIASALGHLFNQPELVVYEFGSGGGWIPGFFVELGMDPSHFVGFEINPDQVALAQSTVPGATFVEADIADRKFFELQSEAKPGKANLTVTSMVIEWLDDTQMFQLFCNALQALNPGGKFFIMTTHPTKMEIDSKLSEPGPYAVRLPWVNKNGEHETGKNYYRRVEDIVGALIAAGFPEDKIKVEDLRLPPDSRAANPEEYDRYDQYPFARLAITAEK